MVQFLTLFLALVVGVHPVELAVAGDRVATIELRLDSKRIGEIRGEPWIIDCDFGDQLQPHTLVAVARDADGVILEQVEQRVNVPRSAAELKVLLDDSGFRRQARLVWRSLEESPPRKITVTVDGTRLPVGKDGRVDLPPVDPGHPHILTAEVEFDDHVRAGAEVAFGGTLGEPGIATLTAVPLHLVRGKTKPDSEQLERWLEIDDAPVRVIAIESAFRDVVLVRDRTASGVLEELNRKALAARNLRARTGHRGWVVPPGVRPMDSVRRLDPVPEIVKSGGKNTGLFPLSAGEDASGFGSLPVALLGDLPVAPKVDSQSFAWAVSSAGRLASARRRVRAVVLLKRNDTPDASDLEPANARRYLQALGVPLFVWRPSRASHGEAEDGWGDGQDISNLRALIKAIHHLEQALESQFIVWIEGDYLPGSVALDEQARSTVRFPDTS